MTNQPVQLINSDLIQKTLELAKESPRRRMNYNFHSTMEENPHRFLNVMLQGTYIQPHRHFDPPKAESFLLLEGRAAFFIFKDDGKIEQKIILDAMGPAHNRGIDIAPGVWHTLHVISELVVCFEVKPGPYTKTSDKEFADWAPAENDKDWQEYQQTLATECE